MSGKPRYDEAAVIASAMLVFWRHGFAGASINDLTAATGLSRSSLYQRFGDKQGLFQEAMAYYTERVLHRMNAVASGTACVRVEQLLRDFVPRKAAIDRPTGCLLARSCAEMADLPDAAQAVVRQGVAQQQQVFAAILKQAQADGELAPAAGADALAWFYVGTLHAVVNLPQAGATPPAMAAMIDIAMSAWPG